MGAVNIRKELGDSFQLLSASIGTTRTVNSMIQVTWKVNAYLQVFTSRVTWIIEFTVLVVPIEADNIWNELDDSF